MQQLHHNRNEKQEVEFFQDKECTIPFDFTNAKDLYIELVYGELTPLVYAIDKALCGTTIYCSYVNNEILVPLKIGAGKKHITIVTLNDITPNLSKYIPEDNAILFLSEEDYKQHKDCFIEKYADNFLKTIGFWREGHNSVYYTIPFVYDKDVDFGLQKPYPKTRDVCCSIRCWKSYTIFLPHGTQAELQKANEVVKELKEKYRVRGVNLFGLHWFVEIKCDENIDDELPYYTYTYFKGDIDIDVDCIENWSINKIITTNSTGILKPEDSKEGLQVIDCFDIFQDHLNNI